MNSRDRLPRPQGGWASALPFLQMTEEKYRALLKEQGYSDHYIENELRRLREARQRHDLPGPPVSKKEEKAGSGPLDRLAKRRRQGGKSIDKKR